MRHFGQPAGADNVLHMRRDRRFLHFLEFAHEAQIRPNGHFVIQRRLFRQIANQPLALARVLEEIHAIHQHLPRRRRQIAREDIERGALARAVLPEQTDNLPFRGAERDVMQGFDRTVALRDMPEFNHGAYLPWNSISIIAEST